MNISEKIPVVFTAMSKHNFHLKDIISGVVLEAGYLPLNPFMSFGYFLNDLVDRDLIRRANNNMIMISDELWVFGIIADGVLFEIKLSMENNKKIKFFNVDGHGVNIKEITNIKNLQFEENIVVDNEFIDNLVDYLNR